MKVLIVDDNRDDRRLLRYIVEREGHEAVDAEDGLEGLRMAKIHKPDLIISDALMPVMDGFQFLRQIKDDEALRSIPFIFYSAIYREDRDVDLAIALGAEAYIIKPKEPAELWDEVECILHGMKEEKHITPELIEQDEEYLKKYSQVVAAKLEEKVRELEESLVSRARLEDELREGEELFKALTDSAQDAIVMIDDEGKACYWNRAAERMFGYASDEIMGKDLHAALSPPRYHEAYRESFPAFREKGEGAAVGRTLELAALRRDGTEFPVELSLSSVLLHGKWNAIGIIRNITDRKRNEEELLRKEAELEKFFSINLDLLCIADTEGNFRRLGRAWESTLGYSPKELMSRPLFDFLHPDDVAATVDAVAALPSQRELAEFVNRYRCRDGTYRWFEWRAAPAGNLIYASARDITERKLSEQKIFRLNRVYSMLSRINEAIVRVRGCDILFEEVCRISVECGNFRMAWIGLLDPQSFEVKPAAFYGLDGEYLDMVRVSARDDMPEGRGPIGRAVRTGTHCICNDIEHDEIMLPWRAEALGRGYRSAAVFPIKSGESVTATVSFYSAEPHFFDEDEIGLLAEVADDISFAVEFINKEQKRQQAESELQERVGELEKFYEMAVGRELRMKELKKEVERLKNALAACGKGRG